MTKIEVFDTDAERISEIADIFQTNTAFVVEALFDYIEHEAHLLDEWYVDLLKDYLG